MCAALISWNLQEYRWSFILDCNVGRVLADVRKVVSFIHGHFGIKLNKTNSNCFFPINCFDYEVNISGILGGDTLEYHDKCWLAWWRTRDVQWSQRSDTIVLMTSTNGWEQFEVMSTTFSIIILYNIPYFTGALNSAIPLFNIRSRECKIREGCFSWFYTYVYQFVAFYWKYTIF